MGILEATGRPERIVAAWRLAASGFMMAAVGWRAI